MTSGHPPLSPSDDLEACIAEVEQRLSALGEALGQNNAQAIEQLAAELHRTLAVAVQRVGQAARNGGVPWPLRHRLARAGGQVAAQRESLARATAALDRAIEVLMPSPIYPPGGGVERPSCGSAQA